MIQTATFGVQISTPVLDFSQYKFRASQLPMLMASSKSKSGLSETTKSALEEIFIKEKYKRDKIIVSKYLEKGTNQESESISLYRKFTQSFCKKNEQKFENDFLIGTPDLIFPNKIVDIKTNWDIWTFFKSDRWAAARNYYYQLVAYMLLTGRTKADLAYCLVSNPEEVIYSELMKIKYGSNLRDDQVEDYEETVRLNNTYEDIPLQERVKIYSFELYYDEEQKIYTQLQKCREYLQLLV